MSSSTHSCPYLNTISIPSDKVETSSLDVNICPYLNNLSPNLLTIKIKLLTPTAKTPFRAHDTDAGLDFFSDESINIDPNHRCIVSTGISLAIPSFYYGKISDRSSMAVKGIDVCAGIIDSGYRGEVKIVLHNSGSNSYKIEKGDKIAQMIITPVPSTIIQVVDELDETVRSVGGFGSSGK